MASTRTKIKKALTMVSVPVTVPVGAVSSLFAAPYSFARRFSFKPVPYQFGPGAWVLSAMAIPLRFSFEVGYQAGKGIWVGVQEGLPGMVSLPNKVKLDTDWRCIKAENHIPNLQVMSDKILCPANVHANDGSLMVHYRAVIKARYEALRSSEACEQYRILMKKMCSKGIHDIDDVNRFIYTFEMYELHEAYASVPALPEEAGNRDSTVMQAFITRKSPAISVAEMTGFLLFVQAPEQSGRMAADKVIDFCETVNPTVARSQI